MCVLSSWVTFDHFTHHRKLERTKWIIFHLHKLVFTIRCFIIRYFLEFYRDPVPISKMNLRALHKFKSHPIFTVNILICYKWSKQTNMLEVYLLNSFELHSSIRYRLCSDLITKFFTASDIQYIQKIQWLTLNSTVVNVPQFYRKLRLTASAIRLQLTDIVSNKIVIYKFVDVHVFLLFFWVQFFRFVYESVPCFEHHSHWNERNR